jgi:hypothetical protein
MKVISHLSFTVAGLLALSGCQDQSDSCARAEAHVARCGITMPESGGSCDAASAQAADEIMAKDCYVLANPATKGDTPQGGSCLFDWECASADSCQWFSCQPRRTLGKPCLRDGHCREGNICYESKCSAERTVGQGCYADSDCEGNNVCRDRVQSFKKKGTCGAASATGAACTTSYDCAIGQICTPSQTCDAPLADGTTCEANEQCDYTCIAGVCRSFSQAGDACDAGDSSDCDFLNCVNGKCQAAAAAGGACEHPFDCATNDLTCWNSQCEPVHARGQPCTSLFDCEHGLFCDFEKKLCY